MESLARQFTEEEMLEEFNMILKELKQDKDVDYIILLKRLLNVEQSVRDLQIFSPNEDYTEILKENLELLDLPFIIGITCQKVRTDRLRYVKESQKYFNIYISLLLHYEICPPLVKKLIYDMKEDGFKSISRDDKIKLYKLEKIFKEEINKEKNREFQKFCKINSQIKAVEAMNKLLFIPQELQILEYKKKMDNDPELKKKWEEDQKNYSPPQMNFFKIDKESRKPNEIIQQYLHERGMNLPDSLKPKTDIRLNPNLNQDVVESYIPKSVLKSRQLMKKDIFKPSMPQPTMTLDEHGELEYHLMMEKQKSSLKYQEEKNRELKRLGIEDEDDSDNELVSDNKTFKARDWDAYKDAHNKGDGNTMGRK